MPGYLVVGSCITKRVHMIMNKWPFFIVYSVENYYLNFKEESENLGFFLCRITCLHGCLTEFAF